jgi:hypothetical protein
VQVVTNKVQPYMQSDFTSVDCDWDVMKHLLVKCSGSLPHAPFRSVLGMFDY